MSTTIYTVIDKNRPHERDNLYIFYNREYNRGHLVIPENININSVPVLPMLWHEEGRHIIKAADTLKFIMSRVIPPDRQNIGDILEQLHMETYDPWYLLNYMRGRCSQDDCYIEETEENCLDEWTSRFLKDRIALVKIVDDFLLNITTMRDTEFNVDVRKLKSHDRLFGHVLSDINDFNMFKIDPDGFSIYWDDDREILFNELIQAGNDK